MKLYNKIDVVLFKLYDVRLKEISVMTMKFKRLISLLIAVALVFCAVPFNTVASAVDSSYLEGVTEEEIKNAYTGTEKLLNFVMKNYMTEDIGQMIEPMIYNDAVVSELLVSVYASMEETASDLEVLGIDVTTKGVAEKLVEYPEAQAVLNEAASFADVDVTKLKWGVTDKYSFARAVSAALSPLNIMLDMLLCSGELTIYKIIKIKGGDGYTTAVLPILNALGCTGILTQEELTLQAAEDKNSIIYNILVSALSLIDRLKEDPLGTLVTVLPEFAYFCESGQLNAGLSTLMTPIKENSYVQLAVKLGLVSFEDITFDAEAMINESLTAMATEGGLKLSPIDFELLSSFGGEADGVYKSDKLRTFVEILRYLLDTLKQNKEQLPSLLPAVGGSEALLPQDAVENILSQETDVILKTYISLFNNTEMPAPESFIFPTVAFTQVAYTQNLTKENFDKVLDGIDELVNEFIAEYSDYSELESILKDALYTNANINALVKGIYTALEKEGLSEVLGVIGVDISPKAVASRLTEGDYAEVRTVLNGSASWSKVNLNGVSWNFRDGRRRGFENSLVASLRPLYPLLEIILCGKDITLIDSIIINGADGYNVAIIPVLEGLGCDSKSIKTYEQYIADDETDAILKNITTPVFDLLDDLLDKPVENALEILPNIVYFIDSGNLNVCINNLLRPVTALTEKIKPVYNLQMDTSSFAVSLNMNDILSSVGSSMGIKLKETDLKILYSLGEAETRTSKQLIDGVNPTYTYIKPDKTALLITVLRYLVDTLKMPENSAVLSESMSGGGADSFALYASQIFAQFEQMTTDEILEWLYNLLFKERVIVPLPEGETYNPTIIYEEPPKDYTPYYIIGGVAAFGLIVGLVFFINRKKLYY